MSTSRASNSNRSSDQRFTPKPVKEWTVMVYLAGDNNLSADCVWALTEMKRGISSDKINVIAQFDPNDGLARTRRYEITREGVVQKGVIRGRKKAARGSGDEDNLDQPIAEMRPALDDSARDFAEWNSRTSEVHFQKESRKAHILADRRQKGKKALFEFAYKLAEGQALNYPHEPDDFGGSRHDSDAASPVTLYNFLSFGVECYPARHYMVVLSGHSAGVEPTYLLRDDTSGNYMTMRQLRAVFDQLQSDLKNGPKDVRADKIDILGLDTCLMSMAEVCCELKDRVGIIIGSETYTPSSGWPYQEILAKLSASVNGLDGAKQLDRFGLAKLIVDEYVNFYEDYVTAGVSVALSALNVEKVGKLSSVVKDLATLMTDALVAEHPEIDFKPEKKNRPFTDALILAHWDTQSYNGEWYVDLVDFCECLSRRYPQPAMVAACSALTTFLQGKAGAKPKDKFIIESAFSGPAYQYSNGVAIYFPWASVARYFWDFDFATRSRWQNFWPFTQMSRGEGFECRRSRPKSNKT